MPLNKIPQTHGDNIDSTLSTNLAISCLKMWYYSTSILGKRNATKQITPMNFLTDGSVPQNAALKGITMFNQLKYVYSLYLLILHFFSRKFDTFVQEFCLSHCCSLICIRPSLHPTSFLTYYMKTIIKSEAEL